MKQPTREEVIAAMDILLRLADASGNAGVALTHPDGNSGVFVAVTRDAVEGCARVLADGSDHTIDHGTIDDMGDQKPTDIQ